MRVRTVLVVITAAVVCRLSNPTSASAQIDLYMADPEVRLAQKIYCLIGSVDTSYGLRATLDGRTIFEKSGPLQSEEIFVANYRNQTAGNHTLTVRIIDSSGQERAVTNRSWITLHSGIPIVGIDENNAIRVNGELLFPVYPATAEVYIDKWVEAGLANTGSDMNFLHPNFNDYTKEEYENWLNTCAALGIRNIGPAARWGGIGNVPHGKGSNLDTMRDYLLYLKENKGVLMWQWSDEPDGGGRGNMAEPDEVRTWTELAHSVDTNHPHAVNLTAYAWARDGAWYIEHCRDYSYLYGAKWHGGQKQLVGDVIGFDFYPIEYATKVPNEFGNLVVDFESMAKALDRIREYNYNLAPIFSWNENCDLHPDRDADGFADGPGSPYRFTPTPTGAEMWAEYWIKIIHGVKGFKIHTAFDSDCRGFDQFNNGQPPVNYQIMAKFLSWMKELKYAVLGPEYNGPNITVAVTGNARVDAMFKEYKGSLYIIAANLRKESGRAKFSIPGLPAGTAIDVYDETRSLASASDVFSDDFGPIAVHVYTLIAPPQNLRLVK